MVQLSSILVSALGVLSVSAIPHNRQLGHRGQGSNSGNLSAGNQIQGCLGNQNGKGRGNRNGNQQGNQSATATNPKAVYFLTNDAKNAVVAMKVNADGTLADGSITETGGAGANGIDGAKNAPAAPDALFSQSALRVVGNVSYTSEGKTFEFRLS